MVVSKENKVVCVAAEAAVDAALEAAVAKLSAVDAAKLAAVAYELAAVKSFFFTALSANDKLLAADCEALDANDAVTTALLAALDANDAYEDPKDVLPPNEAADVATLAADLIEPAALLANAPADCEISLIAADRASIISCIAVDSATFASD